MKLSRTNSSNHTKNPPASQNTLLSKSSIDCSDTEPFYLHPPCIRSESAYNNLQSHTSPELYSNVIPSDGLFVNPMRNNGILTTSSPSGSISGESFYLHDPQEVIYNRVKDLFDSDTCSNKDESTNESSSKALTVQVEVHSSSSGAGSGSEESLSVSSSSDMVDSKQSPRVQSTTNTIANIHSSINMNINANNSSNIANNLAIVLNNNNNNKSNNNINNSTVEHHDYEDIYLVREEARNNAKANKYVAGRSRSRDSGSHSRSASASSTRSTDIVVHYGNHVG